MASRSFRMPASIPAIGALLRYTLKLSPGRFWISVLALTLGLALEGMSIFLLLPLFGFLSGTKPDLHAPITMAAPESLGGWSVSLFLHEILICFVLIVTIAAAINRTKTLYVAAVVLTTSNTLRTDLFDAISKARWSFISRKRKADLDHLLNGDIDRMQGSLIALFSVIQNATALSLYTAISITISPLITALAFLSGIFLFTLSARMRRLSLSFGERYSNTRREQHRITLDFLNGLKVIKSYSAEGLFSELARRSFSDASESFKAFSAKSSLSNFLVQTLNLTIACSFIYFSLTYAALSIEYVLFLFVVFLRINPRFSALQMNLQQLLSDAPAFLGMKGMLEECRAHTGSLPVKETVWRDANAVSLDLKHVSFSADGVLILDNVCIAIEPGDLTVLTGSSGSGKTTLADLIMGLTEPTSGEIYVGDKILTRENVAAWRRRVAYVPQQSFVLAGSIRENLVLGEDDYSDIQLRTALKLSSAQTIVDRLPEGLSTKIGDGGLQISGGELQRLSLARALVRMPQLLILDEVTSGLDAANRDLILAALFTLKGDITILMISHDEEIIKRAPHLVQLEGGRVSNPPDAAPTA